MEFFEFGWIKEKNIRWRWHSVAVPLFYRHYSCYKKL